jgi:hypothetical protein
MVLNLCSDISFCQMLHSRSGTLLMPNEEGPHPVGKQQWQATLYPEFVLLHRVSL